MLLFGGAILGNFFEATMWAVRGAEHAVAGTSGGVLAIVTYYGITYWREDWSGTRPVGPAATLSFGLALVVLVVVPFN